MLEIANHFNEITPADVDRMFAALLAKRAEHEREIALANQAADALDAVRHYKLADARLCSRIEGQCPGTRARVRYDTIYSYAQRGNLETSNWQVWTHGNAGIGDRSQYACVHVQLSRGHSVGELIDALRANTISQEGLARINGQIEGMEELIDAEEHLRSLVKEIETTRERMAQQMMGKGYHYFHDKVRETLPVLTGYRP